MKAIRPSAPYGTLPALVVAIALTEACNVGLPDTMADYERRNPPQVLMSGTTTSAGPGTCAPHASSVPAPVLWRSVRHRAACSEAMLAKTVDCTLFSTEAMTQNCQNLDPTCLACMRSKDSDRTEQTAFVDYGNGMVIPNLEGCIAIESGDTSEHGCGAMYLRHGAC
jgi:hypothetical protein